MSENQYIFVYQTICEVNNKSYVGVHKTNRLDDGYIGCGIVNENVPFLANKKNAFHSAVRKHGYHSFRRYILSFYDTYQEALDEEAFIVNEAWVKSNKNYNCALGGRGSTLGWMTEEQRIEHRKKYTGSKNHRFGKKAKNRKPVLQYDLSNNFIARHESAQDAANFIGDHVANVASCCRGVYGQCRGYVFRYETYSEKEKEKLELNLFKKQRIYKPDGSWEMSESVKEAIKNRPKVKRKAISEETRLKMSLARLGKKRRPHSEETKRKIGLANSKKGKECPIT